MRVKKLIKVWLLYGTGIQLGFLLKGVYFFYMLLRERYCFNVHILNLLQDLFISCMRALAGLRTKDKPLVRSENSVSV